MKLENITIEILEQVILAAGSKNEKKLNALETASEKLEVLKIFIRLTKDVKALDTRKYLQLQEILQEIGKMLGGWLKTTKQNAG